jgi:hypothetical protein
VTGRLPAELLGGGRDYFDALVEVVASRRRVGYDRDELLAQLVEMMHGNYRAVIALGGGTPPKPYVVPRPHQPRPAAQPKVTWRELARRVGSPHGH